jgi:predicted translin family RNA/ssDNA-binding protein
VLWVVRLAISISNRRGRGRKEMAKNADAARERGNAGFKLNQFAVAIQEYSEAIRFYSLLTLEFFDAPFASIIIAHNH